MSPSICFLEADGQEACRPLTPNAVRDCSLCQLGLAHFDRLIWPTLSC